MTESFPENSPDQLSPLDISTVKLQREVQILLEDPALVTTLMTEFRRVLKRPQTLTTLVLIFQLLSACKADAAVSPTTNPSTLTPEGTRTHIPTPTDRPELATPTTQEAIQTQSAQWTQAAFTPEPIESRTPLVIDLTQTPTSTETAPTQDLAAVTALVEKELTIWPVDGGGINFPEALIAFSFEGLDKTPTVEIPAKLGGGKIVWEATLKVGDQEIGVIMAKLQPDGRVALMSSTGDGLGLDLTRIHIRKVFSSVDGKTCLSSLSIVAHPRVSDSWWPTIKVQTDWRDMFFVGSDGKIHVLATNWMCNEIRP